MPALFLRALRICANLPLAAPQIGMPLRPLDFILETTLYVQDVARAVKFYQDVLGLHLLDEFDANKGAALQVGRGVLLLFRSEVTEKPGTLPPHGAVGTSHVAFRVQPHELAEWKQRLRERGVPIEVEHSFNGQPPSVYFRDPDGNVLEFAVEDIWPFRK